MLLTSPFLLLTFLHLERPPESFFEAVDNSKFMILCPIGFYQSRLFETVDNRKLMALGLVSAGFALLCHD